MSALIMSSKKQCTRINHYCFLSHSVHPVVAQRGHGPHKTLYNRFVRWTAMKGNVPP